MSGKLKTISIPLASILIFISLGYFLDRDLARYPIIVRGSGLEREKAIIYETVVSYNRIYSDFYASGGIPARLNEFPSTKAVRHDVFRDIGFIRDTDRVLVYDLADMMPVDVKIFSYNNAEAVVLEQWNYLYQRREDRRPITEMKGMGRGFRYRLVREGHQWMVSGWDTVEVEEPAQKGFYY